MEAIKETVSNFCAGRMGRGKYFCLTILAALVASAMTLSMSNGKPGFGSILITILCDVYIALLTVKRLHDIGYRGTLSLLMFVPGAGEFFMVYLFLKRGQYGENIYGPDPRM